MTEWNIYKDYLGTVHHDIIGEKPHVYEKVLDVNRVYESLVVPPYKPVPYGHCVICGSKYAKMIKVEYSGSGGWTSYYCLRSPIHANGFTIARQTENMSEGNLIAYVTVLHDKNMGVGEQ